MCCSATHGKARQMSLLSTAQKVLVLYAAAAKEQMHHGFREAHLHYRLIVLQVKVLQHALFREVPEQHVHRDEIVSAAPLVHLCAPRTVLEGICEIHHSRSLHQDIVHVIWLKTAIPKADMKAPRESRWDTSGSAFTCDI